MPGRTILLDGHSLAHRAYHALPPTLTDPEGNPVNAVLGFCNMLVKLLEQEKPERIICAFDSSGPVFRHDDFADYKATRKPIDQELRVQIPVIKEACLAFGAEVVELKGFEADDLLGTMSKRLEDAGLEALVVTSDRDSYQLASEKVKLMIAKKSFSDFEIMGPSEVEQACGVGPELVPDLKGLIGDASDNIPGVRGIGEKTAVKLLKEYGSLEKLIASVDRMKQDRTAGLIREGMQMAELSKKLATIDRDAPFDFSPFAKGGERDDAALRDFLARKGFRNLISRVEKSMPKKQEPRTELFGSMPPQAALKPASEPERAYQAVDVKDAEGLREAVKEVAAGGHLALDVVCDGRGWAALPVRLIIGVPGKAYDVPVNAEGSLLGADGLDFAEAVAVLAPLLGDASLFKSGWDIKSSSVMIGKYKGPRFKADFDPMLGSFLINPLGRNDDPADLLFKYFRISPTELEGKAHAARLATAALMPRLMPMMEEEMEGLGLMPLFRGIEMPLVETLAEMELNGVKVDVGRLRETSADMAIRLKALEEGIYELAGGEFNIGSPKQLAVVLFEKLGLPAEKKTKTGYSTDADVLEGLMPLHPIVGKILDYRGISKLKSTYVDVLPELADKHGGRIHTTFNQTGAVTGRLSSSDPNMQNIPIKSEEGLEIRAVFKAEPGNVIISADYSQIELRLLAHLSEDPVLTEAFRLGQDVHTRTAAEVFGVPMDKVTREMRIRAKTVNFGIIYGQSEFGLSRTLGIAQSEAKDFISRYFERYPGVKEYFSRVVEEARKAGYVSTIMGRRRPLPELYSSNFNMRKFGERIAMNAPIQGSAADIIKVAMIRLLEALRKADSRARMLLQVHDELVLESPEEDAVQVASLVKDIMEGAAQLKVPLIAEAGIGPNWKDAK
ncbi:MAG TPA: DNA polymerase I [Bacillota bacterium]|nr:DNA polymerase I [Bacillota bacterium]